MSEEKIHILKEKPLRNPSSGTFELTIRCNLHCKMCLFRHDDSENAEIMANELNTEQWIDMARQAAEAGTFSLLITGGEPMLRPDFCEIWEGIYKFGFLLTLFTIATLVTPKVMETLRKYPPHTIGVTIYGAAPETYEKVCGNADAFQRMIDGTHQLQTLPSIMEFRSTLIKDSFQDGDLIDRLVKREFGESQVVKQACPINKAVRGACANVDEVRIPPEQDMEMKARRMEESIRQIIGPEYDSKYLVAKRQNNTAAVEDEKRTRHTLFGCEAGMSQYTITYEGKLLACQMIGVFFTDAVQIGLQKAWDSFPYQVRIPRSGGTCEQCEFQETCQACYGTRYAETEDFNGCSEYIYRVAKARSKYKVFAGGKSDEKC